MQTEEQREKSKQHRKAWKKKWAVDNRLHGNARIRTDRKNNPDKYRKAAAVQRARETTEQRQKRLAYLKNYHASNKDSLAAKKKARRERAKAGRQPRKKTTPEEKKENARAALRRYQERNREKLRLRMRAARAANPKKARAMWINEAALRKARKTGANAGNPAIIIAWEASWRSKRRVTCYWCSASFGPKRCHTDHIIPLSKGGAHDISNLCISCQPCNSRKSAKALSVWNGQLRSPVLL